MVQHFFHLFGLVWFDGLMPYLWGLKCFRIVDVAKGKAVLP